MTRDELEKLDNETLKSLAADCGVEYGDAAARSAVEDAVFKAYNQTPEEGDAPDTTVETAIKLDKVLADTAGAPPVIQPETPAPAPEAPKPVHTASQTVAIKPGSENWPKSPQHVLDALAIEIARGLQVTFTDNQTCWQMDIGIKQAAGTMKMPVKNIVMEARLLMQRTMAPTEGLEIEDIAALKLAQIKKARR
jgi:hypothetical protein